MSASGEKPQNVSDTAFWVAQYRAEETVREDGLFKDPLASRLIAQKGKSIKEFLDSKNEISWPIVVRTYLMDRVIGKHLPDGFDTVLSLAAGLDTRPYRLDLQSDIKWIEVDLPGILNYKNNVLRDERPSCQLERISIDLTDREARNRFFDRVNQESEKVLVITEGLLVYLDPAEVSSLALDMAKYTSFKYWMMDLASPGLVKMMNKKMGDKMEQANAPFRFGPAEGPGYFKPMGWTSIEVHSFLKTAAALKRVNLWMRVLAMLPESQGKQGSKPWSAVCLFENQNTKAHKL